MKLISIEPLAQYGIPVYKQAEFECSEKKGKELIKLGVAKEVKSKAKSKK